MNRLQSINCMLLLSLLIGACASTSTVPATPTPTPATMNMPATSPPMPADMSVPATPSPMPAGMIMPTDAVHMVHVAEYGGQLGMGETLHIEIVSKRPGEYAVYLSDTSGNPLPLEGVTLEVALIDIAGNELQVFPARLSGDGKYFVAEGDPVDPSNTDVRVKVMLPGGAESVEMDFTLQYEP